MKKVIEEIFNMLGEPVPKEIERKFLIKKPTEEEIQKLGCISKSNIIQTYLKRKNPDTERRVRQRGTKSDGFNFYYTEKKEIGNGERLEAEDKITAEEYVSYLSEADTSFHQISKERYCFIYKNRYYELDVFPFSDTYAILEIELNDINETIELPPLDIIKEVTNNDNFKNHSLAKTLSFGDSEIKNNQEQSEWIYETGREESEILGSGSQYYNVKKTKDEQEAYKLYNIKIRQWYDEYHKNWIDD